MGKRYILIKYSSIFFFILFSVVIVGCDTSKFIQETKLDIVYKTKLYSRVLESMFIAGNSVFISEQYSDGFCEIDMQTGNILKRVENYSFPGTNPVLINEYLYYLNYVYGNEIAELTKINIKNTDDKKVIKLGINSDYFPRSFNLDGYKNRLYWGTWSGEDKGLAYYDISSDMVHMAYICNEEIMAHFIFEDNIMYVNHFPQEAIDSNVTPTTLVALDISNNYSVLWKVIFDPGMIAMNQTMVMYENKIYISNSASIMCVDKSNGKTIWYFNENRGSDDGITIENGKIYSYCGWNSFESHGDNIICIDAETGKKLWGVLYYDGGTICGTPQVYEKILYVASQASMVLFNAETGDFLGADYNIASGSVFAPSYKYKDTMIINGGDYLWSIKMNAHRWLN